MGVVFFFEEVAIRNDNKGNISKCQVEVVDNNGTPEIRIGDEGEAYNGQIAEFEAWNNSKNFLRRLNIFMKG